MVLWLGALTVLRSMRLPLTMQREIVIDHRAGTLVVRNRIWVKDCVDVPPTEVSMAQPLHGMAAGAAAFPELATLAALAQQAGRVFSAVCIILRLRVRSRRSMETLALAYGVLPAPGQSMFSATRSPCNCSSWRRWKRTCSGEP